MDNRPVVQVHTIKQWFALNEQTRTILLQSIKLKDRLQHYLYDLNIKAETTSLTESRWVPCKACGKVGWIHQHPRYPGIHPSQLPHACLLRIWKEMNGHPKKEKIEPRTRLIFDLGTAVHQILQSLGDGDPTEDGLVDNAAKLMFRTHGKNGAWGSQYRAEVPINGREQPLAKELMIEGHVDAENILTIDDIPNSPYIFEVGLVHEYKTINTNGFAKLHMPKPEHQQQALVYSAILDRPVTVYLYLNKNDSNLADFPVPFDEQLWQPILAKIEQLKWFFSNNKTAPGTVTFDCKDCPYVFECEDYKEHAKMMSKAKGG